MATIASCNERNLSPARHERDPGFEKHRLTTEIRCLEEKKTSDMEQYETFGWMFSDVTDC